MRILVINSGSSSIKYKLFDTAARETISSGTIEQIGEEITDYRDGLGQIERQLGDSGAISKLIPLDGIGHRVVHGGESFSKPTLLSTETTAELEKLNSLAPLHNPANLLGIKLAGEHWPTVPQVAVFDTAFHQTLPPHSYNYALPRNFYLEHSVRRFGFHGTSHQYVAKRAAEMLNRKIEELSLITLHLGNGASAAAIQFGRSIDTSMGFTPLEGLVMGTRCGDIDPALVFYLGKKSGLDSAEIERQLNQQSGLKGLCGTGDMREVISRSETGDEEAQLALEIYCYRIKKYIGAYWAALGELDAVVFTAGIGENSPLIRGRVIDGLDKLGIVLDPVKNDAARGTAAEIHTSSSSVKALCIPTDEELEIAQLTMDCISAHQ